MRAQSWQELESLAQNYASHFNHIHISALVCRLPKLVVPAELERAEKAQFNRFLGSVSDLVSLRLPSFDPRAVANVLWGVSKLGYSPAPPLLNKFLFEAYVHMHEFNAQELANLAWALATLAAMGNQPVQAWLQKFVQAAVHQVAALKPQELAHMAWALSRLYPAGAAAASPPTPPQVGTGPAHGSASAAAGNAAALNSRAEAALGEAQAPGAPVATSHAAAATAGSSRPQPARCDGAGIGSAVASTSAPQEPCPSAPLQALVSGLTSRALALLPRMPHNELAMTISALHSLDLAAGWQLLRVGLPHQLRTAGDRLSPQDLATEWCVLGKCAAVGLAPELLQPAAGAAAAVAATGAARHGAEPRPSVPDSASDGNVPSWTRQGADGTGNDCRSSSSTSINAGARQRRLVSGPGRGCGEAVLSRHHLYTLLAVTERSLHAFSAQGLCMLAVAWARLGLHPGPSVLHALHVRLSQVLPAQSSFQCVSITLWALARLGEPPPPPVMSMLMGYARLQVAAARPPEMVSFLWALLQLRYRPSRGFVRGISALLAEMAPRLRPHGLHIVIQAYRIFGDVPPVAVRDAALKVLGANASAAEVELELRAAARPLAARGRPSSSPDAAAAAVLGRTAPHGLPAAIRTRLVRLTGPDPSVAVRFFATVAGVGMPKPKGAGRRAAADLSLYRVREELAAAPRRRAALMASLQAATQERLGQLSTDALCALLTSMARLNLRPPPAFRDRILQQAAARLPGLEPWQAGGMLAALAGLRLRPPPEWVMRALEMVGRHADMMSDRQLLGVLRALARMHFRPPEAWLRALLSELLAREVSKWSAPSLAVLLNSLGALGVRMAGPPCRRLQVLVYRKKRPGAEDTRAWVESALAGAGAGPSLPQGVAWDARLPDGQKPRKGAGLELKQKLCSVCTDLSACAI